MYFRWDSSRCLAHRFHTSRRFVFPQPACTSSGKCESTRYIGTFITGELFLWSSEFRRKYAARQSEIPHQVELTGTGDRGTVFMGIVARAGVVFPERSYIVRVWFGWKDVILSAGAMGEREGRAAGGKE